jgi:hypothetical protein
MENDDAAGTLATVGHVASPLPSLLKGGTCRTCVAPGGIAGSAVAAGSGLNGPVGNCAGEHGAR